jgi:hypothetical protein
VKEEKDKLRDFMQGAFQDYEVAPDPEDWNRIEKTLSERKRRRIIPWIIWAAAAFLLLLLALYTGGILNHTENTIVRTAVNENKTDKTPSVLNAKSAVKESAHGGSDNKYVSTNHPSEKINHNKVKSLSTAAIHEKQTVISGKTINKVSTIKAGQPANVKSVASLIQPTNQAEPKNTLLASNQSKQSLPIVSKDKTITVLADQSVDVLSRSENSNLMVHAISPRQIGLIKNQNKQLRFEEYELKPLPYEIKNSLSGNLNDELANNSTTVKFKGISLNNSSGLIMQSSGKEFMSYSGAFASQLASNMFTNSVKVFDNSLLSSLNIGNLFQNNTRDYLPPITFGLNVNLALENNLSIETGIQYTKLQSSGSISISSSNAIQFTTSFGYTVDENLYYLGVPFIINYTFSQKRKTSYYISGGFSVEKGLIAKYKATPVDNFPGMEPIYSHNAIQALQYSMFGGIGISYKFIKHFELFGQPSMTYYLKSDGKNNTVYSVHPLIFNLRTGIRYTIR